MTGGEDRYARLAAQLLKEQTVGPVIEPRPERRDQVVAAMALAMASKRRRHRVVVSSAVVVAAAATVLLALKLGPGHKLAGQHGDTMLTVEQNQGLGNSLIRNTAQRPLLDGAQVVEGDTVQSEREGSATLGFANGTRLTLSQAGRLRIDELAGTRRFALENGRFQAHVAKLGHGERFIVDTPDAEIEVRGTVFTVAVAPAEDCAQLPQRSSVQVSEGAVWVRAGKDQVLLKPGQSWRSPCPRPTAAPPPARVDRPAATTSGRPAPASPHARAHGVAHVAPAETTSPAEAPPAIAPPATSPPPAENLVGPPSHLAEQNDLFSAAVHAEHKGDHVTALRKLNDLIERFPGGPLLQSARAERERILSLQPR